MSAVASRRQWLPLVGVVTALALVLSGVWVTLAPRPGPSASPEGPVLQNDELVLASLEPSGLPTDAVLVSTVTARGGERRSVRDPASTVNVRYLDRRGAPQTAGDAVLVEVGGAGVSTAVTEATFDKPLPVALHAEYTLDGEVVPARQVVGSSGDLTVRYTVTNTTAERVRVRYEDGAGETRARRVPVFVPFSGYLDVLLPPSLELLDAGTAVRTTDERGRTVLRFPLLLAPPLGDFQAEAVVSLRTSDGSTPQVRLEVAPGTSRTDPATGFSAQALSGAVEGNTELAAGLGELGEQAGLLGRGADDLASGVQGLASGTAQLADQVGGALVAGSRALDEGASALASGTDDLATGLTAAGAGADDVARGLSGLTDGLSELAAGLDALGGPEGLPAAASSAALLGDAAGRIADGVGSAQDPPWPPAGVLPELPSLPDPESFDLDDLPDDLTPEQLAELLKAQVPDLADLEGLAGTVDPPTLVQSLRLLERASGVLVTVSGALVASVQAQAEALVEAGTSSAAAAQGAKNLSAQVCGPAPVLTPQQCDELADVAAQATTATSATARAAKAAAVQKTLAVGLAAGLTGMQSALGLLEQSVVELSTALRSGDLDDPGLVEGLSLLESGLDEAVTAVALLEAGAGEASTGAGALAGGAGELASGLGSATSGARALARGADALATGTSAQVDGVDALAAGTAELAAGARAASTGSAQVAAGVQALANEGIDPVTQAVRDAVAEPALAAAWLAATDDRAADALPYGAPRGAVGFAAYRLTMPATEAGGTPSWQWGLLAVVAVAAAATLVRRRLAQ